MFEGRSIFFSKHAIKRYEQRLRITFTKNSKDTIRDAIRSGKELSTKALRKLGITKGAENQIYIKSGEIIYIVAPTEKQDGYLFITCWKLPKSYENSY